MSLKEQFVKAVEELDEMKAQALAEQLRDAGCDRMEIVDLLLIGMRLVGLRYEGGDYFIADLIMSGIIFREIMNMDADPENQAPYREDNGPCVLVGTVEGDVHDIGKDIFISMLGSHNIDTIDLGVDVSPEVFVKNIRKYRPAIVVLCGVMNFASYSMERTIQHITECGLRSQVKILVGGLAVNQTIARQIKADAFSADLLSGSLLCKHWIERLAEEV